MAEVQLIKIKSLYGDLKGLLSQIPSLETSHLVDEFIVRQLNDTLRSLSTLAATDLTSYEIPKEEEEVDWRGEFPASLVRAQLGRVISRLEQEYGFGENTSQQGPGIVIFNKNQNSITVEINYTLNDLIKAETNEESSGKLQELQEELSKPDKNWEKIKLTLIWILNYSKELFLKVIPILLQSQL